MGNVKTNAERYFFRVGWLLPAVLPLFELASRGAFNTLAVLYVLWGCVVFRPSARPGDRALRGLLLMMLLCFALAIPFAQDIPRAFSAWLKFSFFSLTLFFTLNALRQDGQKVRTLCMVLAVVGLLVPIVLVLKTAIASNGEILVPQRQLLERNMPFLLPFIFWAVLGRLRPPRSLALIAAIGSAYLMIIVFSSGRSALIGLAVAVLVFIWIEFGNKSIYLVPLFALLVAGGLYVFAEHSATLLSRQAEHGSGPFEKLNQLTSGRLDLWRNAITHPPSHPLIGVGMDNARYADEVITISGFRVTDGEVVRFKHKVRHLHNFLFDAWYETGWLGLSALMAFLLFFVHRAMRRLLASPRSAQHRALGAVFAAVLAILAAGLLSFSYTSNQFTVYLFMLLAALFHLSRSANHTATQGTNVMNHPPTLG